MKHYTSRTFIRMLVFCCMFFPIMSYFVHKETFGEFLLFLISVIGARSIAFFVLPEKINED